MKRNPTTKKIRSLLKLINSLTQDEDTKQELFLLYLEGNTSPTSIEKLASKITVTQSVEANKSVIGWLLKSDDSNQLLNSLESLTDLQREVLLLSASGVSIEDISRYNGISRHKIEQLIKSIGNKYGIKETFYR